MARLHSQILVHNDDKFSKKAVMTTKFLKNCWQVPWQLGEGHIFSLKHKVTETDIAFVNFMLFCFLEMMPVWNGSTLQKVTLV